MELLGNLFRSEKGGMRFTHLVILMFIVIIGFAIYGMKTYKFGGEEFDPNKIDYEEFDGR